MTYKYYLTSRPPSIGTHPSGEVDRETWMPKKFDDSNPSFPHRGAFGYVVYDKPLSMDDIYSYELVSDDLFVRFIAKEWQINQWDNEKTLLHISTWWNNNQLETMAQVKYANEFLKNVFQFRQDGRTIQDVQKVLETGTY